MQEENLKASWRALLEVAATDGRTAQEALEVVRQRPGCLIAPAEGFQGKTLAEFEAGGILNKGFGSSKQEGKLRF